MSLGAFPLLLSNADLVFLAEFFPDWGEGFAVSAPWGIEFNEDVLGWVHDEVVEVLANDDFDGVFRVIWDFFGFQVTLKMYSQKVWSRTNQWKQCVEQIFRLELKRNQIVF